MRHVMGSRLKLLIKKEFRGCHLVHTPSLHGCERWSIDSTDGCITIRVTNRFRAGQHADANRLLSENAAFIIGPEAARKKDRRNQMKRNRLNLWTRSQ